MFRFLHLADLHFDTIFASRREATRLRLRDAVRRGFESAVDCAIQEDLDAVVVAGDLFDNDRLSYSTERFIIRQIERLNAAEIPFLYCTGNHDPGGPTGRAVRIEWPRNCTIVATAEPKTIRLSSKSGLNQVAFVLAGHDSNRVSANLANEFPFAVGAEPHVGVLHAHVVDSQLSGRHKMYAPCTVDDLASKGYAYWALGHIHLRQQVSDKVMAMYPGNIQGRTPRESGKKGGLIVSIDHDGFSSMSFREFGPVVWDNIDVTVSEDTLHLDQLARLLESQAEDLGITASDRMVRFILAGTSTVVSELRRPSTVDSLEESLRDVLGVLDVEIGFTRLSLPLSVDQYRSEPHVLGQAIKMLEKLSSGTGEGINDLLGDDAVVDWSNADDDMKSELLEGIAQDIIGRMLKDA